MVYQLKTDSPRRLRRRTASTERIIEVSMRTLAREGLGAFTVHRLAEELDYTVGAIYRYFPSKDALLAEMERRVVLAFGETFDSAWGRLDGFIVEERIKVAPGALAAVLVTARLFSKLPELYPEGFALVTQTLADPRKLLDDETDKRVSEATMTLFKRVAQRIEAARTARALKAGEPGQRAAVLWSALQGAMMLRKLDRFEAPLFDARNLTRPCADALVLGWGADQEVVDGAHAVLDALERLPQFYVRHETSGKS